MDSVDLISLALLLAHLVLSILLAKWLARARLGWSYRRLIVVPALPIPLLVWAFCAYVFLDAATASQEECGVDACGMAMAASIGLGAMTFLPFLAGLAVAAFVVRKQRERRAENATELSR